MIWIIIGIITIFLIFKIKTHHKKYRCALSALLAKHTFTQLNKNDKPAVIAVMYSILRRGGISDAESWIERASSNQKYLIMSLAMAELSIEHDLFNKFGWHYIERPMTILNNADRAIKMAENTLSNLGIQVIMDAKMQYNQRKKV